eukprot:jgi/Mesvir1/21968/Mv26454-RA.1
MLRRAMLQRRLLQTCYQYRAFTQMAALNALQSVALAAAAPCNAPAHAVNGQGRAKSRRCGVNAAAGSRAAVLPSCSFVGERLHVRSISSKPALRHSSTTRCEVAAAEPETFQYQAEVSRVMDMIVHSLYSNKDIFLRELVSNASDALDKIRFLSVANQALLGDVTDLNIRIRADPEANTISIRDTGVGMTHADLIQNLGTIASSGTTKFMEMLKAQGGATGEADNLIGKFGVGFYSAFLVADRVVVRTKHNDDVQWRWESEMESNTFTVAKDSGEALGRGTEVIIHLKEGMSQYAEDAKINELVKTYSEFISFPIQVWSKKSVPKQVPDTEAPTERDENGEEKVKMKTIYEDEWSWQLANANKPIWMRAPKDVTDEEYNAFYKSCFREFIDPAAHTHFVAEGDIEFRSILFVPGMPPFDSQELFERRSKNIKLYVRRVFISDEFDESLMPRYLSFVKGLVDSSDLPLNVSREILQESKVVKVMRKRLVKKSLDMIKSLADKEDQEAYDNFWESFGRSIKLGVIEDKPNAEMLGGLLRFYSSKSGDKMTSLAKYVERMKEGQKAIYYLAADSRATAGKAPFVEELARRDMEVLYLVEPIDEVCISNLAKFSDKPLVDVSKEGLELDEATTEEAKKEKEKEASELEPLLAWMKSTLGEKVEKVVVSSRASSAPCILVTSKFGWSANMERIMKAQAMGDDRSMEFMKGKKIMEINPKSPIIMKLNELAKSNPGDPKSINMVNVLFDTAMLNSGFQLESSNDYAARVHELMAMALE